MDVNGDGYPDIVVTDFSIVDGKRANLSKTYLGTGIGHGNVAWVEDPVWRIPDAALPTTNGETGIRLLDINGDGLPDLVFSRAPATAGNGGVFVNNGAGWPQQGSLNWAPPAPFGNADGTDNGVRVLDLNGDGLPDLAMSYVAADGSRKSGAWTSHSRRADVLQEVDDGLGVRTVVCYMVLSETLGQACNTPVTQNAAILSFSGDVKPRYGPAYSRRTRTAAVKFPLIEVVPPTYVVKEAVIEEAPGRKLDFMYWYGSLVIDTLSKRSLGFRFRDVDDLGAKATTVRQVFNQDFWTQGLIDDMEVRLLGGTGTLLNKVHNDWKVVARIVAGGTSARVLQTGSSSTKFNPDGSQLSSETTTFNYDDYSNVTASLLQRDDGTSIARTNGYPADPMGKRLGRLIASEVTKAGKSIPNEVRRASFTYDSSTQLLAEEVANVGTTQELSTRYERDKFGNITMARTRARGEPDRTTSKTFDDLGRYAVVETNALGQEVERTYSPEFGSVLSERLPDGRLTTHKHDGFDRETESVNSAGLVTDTSYIWAKDIGDKTLVAGRQAVLARITQIADLPPRTSLLDSRFREVRGISLGFGGKLVFHDVDFDVYGRVVSETLPYFRGNKALLRRVSYDQLDRTLTAQDAGIPLATVHRFTAKRETIVDPNSHTTILTRNSRGLTETVEDAKRGVTEIAYDAGDRVLRVDGPRVSDGTKATTSYSYDQAGRRSVDDPDLGKWEYRYDPFGELIWQRDAKGQTATLEYDKLGRVVKEVSADRVDTWVYDAAQHGFGKLTTVSSSNGTALNIAYDPAGREAQRSTTVGGESFATATEYDRYGRTYRILYPDGFIVRNEYDKSGILLKVVDEPHQKTLWTGTGFDALGRVLADLTQNRVRNTRKFDASTGYLVEYDTSGTSSYQNVQLQYDKAGNNVIQRKDLNNKKEEILGYDELDRLTSLKASDGAAQSFDYDAAGRMITKSGLGELDYKARPYHAPAGLLEDDGTRHEYTYDGNGNRSECEQGYFNVSANNLVTLVYAGPTQWSKFDYDAGGHMVRKYAREQLQSSETIYAGLYERISDVTMPVAGRPVRQRHRDYLLNGQGVFAVYESIGFDVKTPVSARDVGIEALDFTGSGLPKLRYGHFTYMVTDYLGSIVGLTDEDGTLKKENTFSYDVWGSARQSYDLADVDAWTRGYLGNEELPERLVHMGGRIYDPSIGSFISPDLVVREFANGQDLNRHAYARNNPATYSDPSGYWSIGSVTSAVGNAIGGAANAIAGAVNAVGSGVGQLAQGLAQGASAAGQWLQENWRAVVIVGAAVGLAVLSGGTASPILAGMISGALTGALGSTLYGGSVSDVLRATLEGAAFGGIAAGIGDAFAAGGFTQALMQGNLGGIENVARGGEYVQGFETSVVASIAGDIGDIEGFSGSDVVRISAGAALGGTVSAIDGGKFANGALWGAFAGLELDSESLDWKSQNPLSLLAQESGLDPSTIQVISGVLVLANSIPTSSRGLVSAATYLALLDDSQGNDAAAMYVGFIATGGHITSNPFLAASVLFYSATANGDRTATQVRGPSMLDVDTLSLAHTGSPWNASK